MSDFQLFLYYLFNTLLGWIIIGFWILWGLMKSINIIFGNLKIFFKIQDFNDLLEKTQNQRKQAVSFFIKSLNIICLIIIWPLQKFFRLVIFITNRKVIYLTIIVLLLTTFSYKYYLFQKRKSEYHICLVYYSGIKSFGYDLHIDTIVNRVLTKKRVKYQYEEIDFFDAKNVKYITRKYDLILLLLPYRESVEFMLSHDLDDDNVKIIDLISHPREIIIPDILQRTFYNLNYVPYTHHIAARLNKIVGDSRTGYLICFHEYIQNIVNRQSLVVNTSPFDVCEILMSGRFIKFDTLVIDVDVNIGKCLLPTVQPGKRPTVFLPYFLETDSLKTENVNVISLISSKSMIFENNYKQFRKRTKLGIEQFLLMSELPLIFDKI